MVRIPHLPPAEAGTVLDIATPEGCKAELTYRLQCLYSVHRCGLLLQLSHVAWSVCLCVCWAYGWALQNWLNQSRCNSRTDSCGCREPCARWGGGGCRSPTERASFRERVPAHCIYAQVHCLPAATGERICTVDRNRWQNSELLWRYVTLYKMW